jgi:hypothetical protein
MKKVKYNGQNEALLPLHGLVVHNGDVIEVEDEFENALFEEIKEKLSKKDGDAQ